MEKKIDKTKDTNKPEKDEVREGPDRDHPQTHHAPESKSSINNPARNLPAYNPPVPNRAWTEMKQRLSSGNQINALSNLTPEELTDLNYGPKLR